MISNPQRPSTIAIIDYGLGNLFSVEQACRHAGAQCYITSAHREILAADAALLPGVGAFGDAVHALSLRDLIGPLRDLAASGTPLIGICLGMQLLMTESCEFGKHRGLDIIRGEVVQFSQPRGPRGRLKVPQVGWAQVNRPPRRAGRDPWQQTPLDGQSDGPYMYFVHSYFVRPEDPAVVLSTSQYGGIQYCSAIHQKNVWAFQFHPERSGPEGLRIYQQIVSLIQQRARHQESDHAA